MKIDMIGEYTWQYGMFCYHSIKYLTMQYYGYECLTPHFSYFLAIVVLV